MRIAVAGGTGLVGRPTVEALRWASHEAVVLGPRARLAATTFDAWLERQRAVPSARPS